MPLTGNIRSFRFTKHSRTLAPSQAILDSHYPDMDQDAIRSQTNSADWFLAVLQTAPGFGGVEGELYVIFNPTNATGKPVTSATVPAAKICGAPCPPFCDEESDGLIEKVKNIEKRVINIEKLVSDGKKPSRRR